MNGHGKQVRILDGTAAVCAEPVIRWRKPVIGKPRRQNAGAETSSKCRKRESEDLQEEGLLIVSWNGWSNWFYLHRNTAMAINVEIAIAFCMQKYRFLRIEGNP